MVKCNMLVFHEGLLAIHATPILEDHPLLALCSLFNIFAVALHVWRLPWDMSCGGGMGPTQFGG